VLMRSVDEWQLQDGGIVELRRLCGHKLLFPVIMVC
jgi:hypothetical protein